MSGIYGSFLIAGTSYHKDNYGQFCRRVAAINTICELVVKGISNKDAELASYISVCYPNIVVGCTRYFNDVVRLKAMHKISRLQKSKMISYTAKWMALYPPISVSVDFATYKVLTQSQRIILFNANFLVIQNMLAYYYRDKGVSFTAQATKLRKMIKYLLSTATFEEHAVSALVANTLTGETL